MKEIIRNEIELKKGIQLLSHPNNDFWKWRNSFTLSKQWILKMKEFNWNILISRISNSLSKHTYEGMFRGNSNILRWIMLFG